MSTFKLRGTAYLSHVLRVRLDRKKQVSCEKMGFVHMAIDLKMSDTLHQHGTNSVKTCCLFCQTTFNALIKTALRPAPHGHLSPCEVGDLETSSRERNPRIVKWSSPDHTTPNVIAQLRDVAQRNLYFDYLTLPVRVLGDQTNHTSALGMWRKHKSIMLYQLGFFFVATHSMRSTVVYWLYCKLCRNESMKASNTREDENPQKVTFKLE